jgi:ATP-dependent DNA helicase RecQ
VLTAKGVEALRERRAFEFVKPRGRAAKGKRKSAPSVAVAGDEVLFEALRALRRRLADEEGVPPYVVFSDATLRQMAASQPQTRAALRQIGGVGDVKLERYGAAFVDAIAVFRAKAPTYAVDRAAEPR